MNSETLFTDTFKNSDLMNVSLKINKLRNLIDGHLISIDSDFGNIIDDIENEKTADNIIDSVINSISETNQTSHLDNDLDNDINNDIDSDIDNEQISETSEKNSFSVSTGGDINITSDISNFLNTETETPSTNYKNKIYKMHI